MKFSTDWLEILSTYVVLPPLQDPLGLDFSKEPHVRGRKKSQNLIDKVVIKKKKISILSIGKMPIQDLFLIKFRTRKVCRKYQQFRRYLLEVLLRIYNFQKYNFRVAYLDSYFFLGLQNAQTESVCVAFNS